MKKKNSQSKLEMMGYAASLPGRSMRGGKFVFGCTTEKPTEHDTHVIFALPRADYDKLTEKQKKELVK